MKYDICISCVQDVITRENFMIKFSSCGLEIFKNLQLAGGKGTALFLIFINKICTNHVFFDY